MRQFIPTTVKTSCPVCEDTSGKCRTFDDSDINVCMPLSNKHDAPNGFQFHNRDLREAIADKGVQL